MKRTAFLLALLMLTPLSCKKGRPVEKQGKDSLQGMAKENSPAGNDKIANLKKAFGKLAALGKTMAQTMDKSGSPIRAMGASGKADKTDALAKGLGAMAKLGKALAREMGTVDGKTGKVVPWRKLATFLPDSLGAFKAGGDVRGRTSGFAGMNVTTVRRNYRAGEKRLRIKIVDTTMAPMMKMGFTMALSVNQDSSKGFKKGKKVQGFPAMHECRKTRNRAKLSILVGGRFMAELLLRDAANADEIIQVAKSMNLTGMAALK